MDSHVLDQLLAAAGPVTFDQLAKYRAAGGNKAAWVWRELDALRQAGCHLDVHPQRGVVLLESGLGTWSDYLTHRYPGRMVEVYRQTASTQDVARRMIEASGAAADGALAITDVQSAGRGRLGRSWQAVTGAALLFSCAMVRQKDAVTNAAGSIDHLTLVAAVAVARGIERACRHGLNVRIKWPNDLLIDHRKVAGVLIETHTVPRARGAAEHPLHAAVVGIGVNVHQQPDNVYGKWERGDGNEAVDGDPADDAMVLSGVTSLRAAGCAVDRLRVLVEIIAALDETMSQRDAILLAEWRERCVSLGQPVRLRSNGRVVEGQVVDLDAHEGLIVRTATGQMAHLPAATTSVI